MHLNSLLNSPGSAARNAQSASNQGQAAPSKLHIFNVPVDLTRVIFLFYYSATGTPLPLLFVCRRWHNLALEVSPLWINIQFQPWRRDYAIPSIERTMHLPIICLSWTHLVLAVKRAGELLVKMTCDLANFDQFTGSYIEDYLWLSTRCRYLRVNYSGAPALNFINIFCNLINLEELSIGLDWRQGAVTPPDRFLENIEAKSNSLSSLEILDSMPSGLGNHSSLLARLKRLSVLKNQSLDHILKHTTNLEDLAAPLDSLTALQHVSGKLHPFTIINCSAVSVLTLGRLTSLTIRYSPRRCVRVQMPIYDPGKDSDPIYLPVLRYLSFTGFWQKFAIIDTPMLVTLVLRLHKQQGVIPPPMSRPKSLIIDDSIQDKGLVGLLRGVWSDAEEIEWAYNSPGSVGPGEFLMKGLGGTELNDPLCPRLRRLTVNTMQPSRMSTSTARELVQSLREIVKGRWKAGFVGPRNVWCQWNGSGGVAITQEGAETCIF